jgi:glycosidase
MTALFDYPLYFPLRRVFTQGASFHDIIYDEAHDWLFADPNRLVTFLGLHDLSRFMSEKGVTAANLELAQTFLLTNRGIPMIYYGDEIGMPGGDDPDNRRDFPGGFPGDARDAFTNAGRTPQEREIWNHLRRLTHLRASLAPLRRGTQRSLYLADKQWVYARQLGGDTVLIALNNAASPATFTVPLPGGGFADGDTLPDRIGDAPPLHISGGAATVTLPAYSGSVFAK